MPAKRWVLQSPAGVAAHDLTRSLKVHPILAQLLAARGFEDVDTARRFLDPSLDHCHDPFLLPDMERAVERLAQAIRAGERILVHGDYDVDGICSASLLTRVLRALNANVECFVPHRLRDGYDLQLETVRRVAAEGIQVIVTVDCGILAYEAADAARALGIDLIVTDHHEPRDPLPDAYAVVNPKRPGSRYPCADICGTAVAYKVAFALVRHLGLPESNFRTNYLDLVALATAADCMPLTDENRVFVKYGLQTLKATKKVGLKALMQMANVQPATLNARSLGFSLGPRLNAVGRIDAAEHGLQLLLTSDAVEAERLAARLEECNRERQAEQERIFSDALRQAGHYVDDRILVLAGQNWHSGIVGIVASKIVEALCRPAIVVAIDAEEGLARGSARSVEGYHIYAALTACSDVLIRCGGHQAAAGFDIRADRLEDLRTRLRSHAEETLVEELLEPSQRVDAELSPNALDLRLARELLLLEPFGHGNHEPVFVTRGLNVVQQSRIAAKVKNAPDHLKLRLDTGHRAPTDAIFWRGWARASEIVEKSPVDVCYSLEVNTYNGYQNLQFNLKDLCASGGVGTDSPRRHGDTERDIPGKL